MTLRELLDPLKGLGVTLTLHDGDTISIEPSDVLPPAVRAALTEHHAARVALIRSGPASPSSFDTLMTAFDGLGARRAAAILQEPLRTLAAGLAGADPLVRALVRAAARLVDAGLTARLSDAGRAAPGRWLLVADPDPWSEAVEGAVLLEGFQVKAKQIRQGLDTRKGYLRADFTDACRRYLPADPKHPQHPKHRHGAAEFAIQRERGRPGAGSGRGQPPSPAPTREGSDVSGTKRRGSRGEAGVTVTMATDTGRAHEPPVGLPVTPGAPDAPKEGGLTHPRGQRWKPGGATNAPIPGGDDPNVDQALRARQARTERRAQ